MNWSFRLARVAGIAINVHVTFFIIVALGAFQWGRLYGTAGAVFGAVLMLLLFVCVTLHELGHALAARFFDIPVREIILLPLGGVALLERVPEKPLHELIIAAAGPLVNVVLALLLWAATGADMTSLDGQGLLPGPNQGLSIGILLNWLLQANISLVLFNLIPAFPLDGGRIFRALLAMAIGFRRATRVAVLIGQSLAILLGVYGVVSGNYLLVLVAVFVFFGASQEQSGMQVQNVLTSRQVGDAYNKHALTLQLGDRVSTVVNYILTSYQPDFAVMQGSNPIGIVTRDDVIRALSTTPSDSYVTGIMNREIVKVEANVSLDDVRHVMAERNVRVVAVYEGATYLGLVSIEDIAEAFSIITYQERQRAVQESAQGL